MQNVKFFQIYLGCEVTKMIPMIKNSKRLYFLSKWFDEKNHSKIKILKNLVKLVLSLKENNKKIFKIL